MKEIRLSIPVIGGVTVVYTADEINNIKTRAKDSMVRVHNAAWRAVGTAARFTHVSLDALATKIEAKAEAHTKEVK